MRQSRQYNLLQIDEHLTPIFRLLGYLPRQLVNDLVRHDAGEHISVEVASDLLKDDEHTHSHTHTPVAYITKIIDNELYRGLAEFTELIEIHFDRDCTLYFSDTQPISVISYRVVYPVLMLIRCQSFALVHRLHSDLQMNSLRHVKP